MGRDCARLVNWVRRAQIRRAARYPFHGLPTKKHHHHHISLPERCSKQFAAKHGKNLQKSPAQKAKEEEGGGAFCNSCSKYHSLVGSVLAPTPTNNPKPTCVFFSPPPPPPPRPSRKWRANTLSIIRAKCGRSNPADFLFQNIRRFHSLQKNNFRKTIRI